MYLDNNNFPAYTHHSWECLVAAGGAAVFQAGAGTAFEDLHAFCTQKNDWLFGFFGYDLKNETEKLNSSHPDGIDLPDLLFFQPEYVVGIRRTAQGPPGTAFEIVVHSISLRPAEVLLAVQKQEVTPQATDAARRYCPPLSPRLPYPDYVAAVAAIRRHIIEGDVYELNLCQEFFAENADIEPLATFERLNALTQAPFAAYFRWHDRYLLCASPERFLRKERDRMVSQPIKGTRRRHPDPAADARIREQLRASEKDRAENVMIVDLVRNDLARHCRPGSVRVEELFGIYSFRTVHQMISTVSGLLEPGTRPVEALRDAFPMGSMTGAPKVMAMELIERYERTRRGLYSGALGYFTPEADFDFNVVIRSILYNAATGYLSCQVGGAIVYDSLPEQEYEECLVKARALLEALGMQPT
ncbi:MAG: anthranilate synthase component I family protein [Saprospirales bacterium]|nr:anthranilate synthase component I family protein [Saprospirales bacterium]